MITDVQLAVFANVLGVSLFLLVILYHYISANNPRVCPVFILQVSINGAINPQRVLGLGFLGGLERSL